MLAAQQAELNRDKKKRKKPFTMEDFCMYDFEEKKDAVDPVYGAAAKKLIENQQFPVWALFVYKELSERADETSPPNILCYQSEEAIILAPELDGNTCKGMLIAMESASLKVLEMNSPCGSAIRAKMPEIKAKLIAEENHYLNILSIR